MNHVIVINETLCQSVKSKRENTVQCPHAKKQGDYCGTHARSHVVQRIIQIKPEQIVHKLYQYPELSSNESIDQDRLHATLAKYSVKTLDELKELLRQRYTRDLIATAGPAKLDRKVCQNETDFYQLDQLNEIPDHLFFSFAETFKGRDRIYGCDIRSFHQYVINEKTVVHLNPYNRQPLNDTTHVNYLRRLNFLTDHYPDVEFEWPKQELTAEERLNFRVLDVFQIMYGFDYAVDHRWFLALSREELLKYYMSLQEIWNFRLNLTDVERRLIVPDQPDIFSRTEYKKLRNLSRMTLQERLIDKMAHMVTKGVTVNDRKNGAMYLLLGLVEICREAAENLPYLAFSAGLVL